MKQRILIPLATLILSCAVTNVSADTLYKCTGESGVVLYTNQKTSGKNCTVLSRDLPISTIASPPKSSARAATATQTLTPNDFPRVDSGTQRGRDGDRRKILEQEFNTEQQNLDKARRALSEGEATRLGDEKSYQKYLERVQELKDGVALHERNIEALKRELANLK